MFLARAFVWLFMQPIQVGSLPLANNVKHSPSIRYVMVYAEMGYIVAQ